MSDNIPANRKVIRCVAIWLQLDDGQALIGEGTGIHLGNLLTGMQELKDVRVIVCAPRWTKKVLEQFLYFFNIQDAAEIRYFGIATRHKPRKSHNPRRFWLSLPSKIFGFIPEPLVLTLASTFGMPYRMLCIVRKRLQLSLRSVQHHADWALNRALNNITYSEMAYHIDSAPEIDACIVPLGTWAYSRYVRKKPVTVQVPDIVFLEFPEIFDTPEEEARNVERRTTWLVRTAHHATRVIAPSTYVCEVHHRGLGIPARKSKVVHHAPIRLDLYLQPLMRKTGLTLRAAGRKVAEDFFVDTTYGATFDGYVSPQINPEYLKRIKKKIRRYGVISKPLLSLERFGRSAHWLASIVNRGAGRRPIFYFATQNRPYKNIGRLLLAIDTLKKSHGLNPLLILTAEQLYSGPNLVAEVAKHNLYENVLCLPRLSSLLHAAMYTIADLTVSASMFEGGFPFLFGESLSVDTPIIMARIPVVMEILPPELHEMTLFEPRSTESMVEAILRGLSRRDELLAAQKVFYQKLCNERSWTDVARDYLSACAEGFDELELRRQEGKKKDDLCKEILDIAAKNQGFVSQDFWLK